MNPLCRIIGHKWSRSLDDMPEGAIFWRIDCTRWRCDKAIDGARLRELPLTPEMRKLMKLP